MIIYLTLPQILDLHRRALEQSGGLDGIRDLAALTGSLATPRATFDGKDLYPSVVEKAAALGFSLTANHPFNDGNKRVGHAALETVLILNGFEIEAEIDAAERVMLGVAAGTIDHAEYLPQLVAKPEDCTADFVATLEQMATKYPIFGHALDRLSSNDRWC